MRNIALTLSYSGTAFLGWQKTPFGSSVEGCLQQTLERILRHKVKLQAASRTDAGVHARGQVVNFYTENSIDLPLLQRALNGTLPKEIATLHIEEKPLTFHPTLDSIKKEYHYQICTGRVQLPFYRDTSWHFPKPLEIDLMRSSAEQLLGTHDFSAFCNQRSSWDRDPICTLYTLTISRLQPERLLLRIIGDHFLYKMVRNLVGTLAYIGSALIPPDEISHILASKQRARAGITAPSHGLFLHQVRYAL